MKILGGFSFIPVIPTSTFARQGYSPNIKHDKVKMNINSWSRKRKKKKKKVLDLPVLRSCRFFFQVHEPARHHVFVGPDGSNWTKFGPDATILVNALN